MSDECDKKVYEKGTQVFLTHTIAGKDIEKWVKKIAKKSGQKVDWHYFGGRAVILALGNIKKVNEAIVSLKDEHDKLFSDACKQYLGDDYETKKMIEGIWQYNGL